MLNTHKTHLNILILSGFFILLFTVSQFVISNVYAQTNDYIKPTIIADNTSPEPFSVINFRVDYFLSDLDRANISWLENGITKERGIGLKTFSTQVGSLGSETRISVKVTTQDGKITSQKITLRPTTVDIVWEADTYTPPFYKGKALPSPQSGIKVVALPTFITPSGSRIQSNKLFYKWFTSDGTVAGVGKNTIFLNSDLLNDNISISVKITSPGGSLVKERGIVINSVATEIILYKEDALTGPHYEKEVTNSLQFSSNEISLRAEPFYFSNKNILPDTQYKWSLNNKEIDPHNNNSKIVTLVGGQENIGSKLNLKIEIISPTKIRQIAEKILKITL